eukprot:scaffold2366_cov51-Phaeocystis_antarctica.AAC.2
MSEDDLLNALPLELQLYIADAVGERCDRAALALASPRLLGLAACRQLPSYQGLEMSLAFHYVLGGAIDEQLLRTYAGRSVANARKLRRRLKRLTRLATAAGLRKELRLVVLGSSQTWYLMELDSPHSRPGWEFVGGVLLVSRSGKPEARTVVHYEGDRGAEHVVRWEAPNGTVSQFEGEKGAEHMVRLEAPSGGTVSHFTGEKGAEQLVRCELPSGEVRHFEGEKGAERVVRLEALSGAVSQFEGDRGAEHVVCLEAPNGNVGHYEGEKDAERLVRNEQPGGNVRHFEGEQGAERLVSSESPCGRFVHHYEGEKDAERVVRTELPIGIVRHYEGEKDAERRVRCELPSGEVWHYEGEKDAERRVRCELPSGEVWHLEGERRAERLVRCELTWRARASLQGREGRAATGPHRATLRWGDTVEAEDLLTKGLLERVARLLG